MRSGGEVKTLRLSFLDSLTRRKICITAVGLSESARMLLRSTRAFTDVNIATARSAVAAPRTVQCRQSATMMTRL